MQVAPLLGMPDPPDVMTLGQASIKHDIGYNTLYAAVRRGDILRFKYNGHRILVLAGSVAEYARVHHKFKQTRRRRNGDA